jgi:hypothetical protein
MPLNVVGRIEEAPESQSTTDETTNNFASLPDVNTQPLSVHFEEESEKRSRRHLYI